MALSAITQWNRNKLLPQLGHPATPISARFARGLTLAAGTVVAYYSGTVASEVQSLAITGSPTGGTFTLTYDGQTTSALAYNATAAQVQAALEALTNIGTGNVVCTGGALPGTAITITFRYDLASMNVPAITTTDSLTGGTSPASAITTSTAGNGGTGLWAAYNDSNSDGTQVARGILASPIRTDSFGRITFGDHLTNEHGVTDVYTAPVYITGCFLSAALTGLDANGTTDLHGRTVGDLFIF